MPSTITEVNYTNNSIFTDYALNLINKELIGEHTDFDFRRVTISNEATALDSTSTSTKPGVYTLKVNNISYSNNTCTVEITVPKEVINFTIRTVAIYNFDGEKDRLFAYANINAIKPAQLSFDLVVDLNFELQYINIYPHKVNVSVKDTNYVSHKDKQEIVSDYSDVIINLERVEDRTTKVIGYNKPEVFYNKERTLAHNYDTMLSVCKYGKMCSLFDNTISDYYFNDTNAMYSFYKIRNLNNLTQYMDVSLNKMITYDSNFHFNSEEGSTVIVNVYLDIFEDSFILKKGTLNNGTNEFIMFIENNALKVRVYSVNNSYFELQYVFTEADKKELGGYFNTIIFTFNNDFKFPSLSLYINEKIYKTTIIYNGIPDRAILTDNIPITSYYTIDEDIVASPHRIKLIATVNKSLSIKDIRNITRLIY